MRFENGRPLLTPTDLARSLACRTLTALDLLAASGRRVRPFRRDPLIDVLIERGLEHERAYVAHLVSTGRRVVDLSEETESSLEATLAAMEGRADVIVQPSLAIDRWFGRADVLLRVNAPGRWAWSYEAVDTKLAQETKAGSILQLGLYSALLAQAQGRVPEFFHIVTSSTGFSGETFRVSDYAAYTRCVRGRLEADAVGSAESLFAAHYPEPVSHCEVCAWLTECDGRRRADDHLSLVAGASRSQRDELRHQGFATVEALARVTSLEVAPSRGSLDALRRVAAQAKVQFRSRGLATPIHVLRDGENRRGLGLLPTPDRGDVFLDLEGDPFAAPGGREYLFGIAFHSTAGERSYRSWWGLTAADEAAAFRDLVRFIEARRLLHPSMHVFHFAPYEPAALKRLMGRHSFGERIIDGWLRNDLFVDLYSVVRQSLFAGVERYSIKNLEALFGFERAVPLDEASFALRGIERYLELQKADDVPANVRALVEGYNRDDCFSTVALRDWLEGLRKGAIAEGRSIPRPMPREESEKDDDPRSERVEALRRALLLDVPDERDARDADQQARWVLAYLLDWHRREDKASWWEYFRLRDLPPDELIDEKQAVAGLEFVSRTEMQGTSITDRYRYPPQEVEIRSGDELKESDGSRFGRLARIDRRSRMLEIRKKSTFRSHHPTALFAHTYIPSATMEQALLEIASAAIADGGVGLGAGRTHQAARRLLLREPPRLRTGAFDRRDGESDMAFAIRVVSDLDESVFAIQGPPGAGKTHAGARMIASLVCLGLKVGVTSTSHKVILNLLEEVRDAVPDARIAHRAKVGDDERGASPAGIVFFHDNDDARRGLTSGTQVLGGTPWLWSRSEFERSVDVLFVDEAGQVSLANVVAVSRAASSVVLLGDPQQLEQPEKGAHPEGINVSALGHLLGEHETMPTSLGLFLPTTRRLAPEIAAYTSEVFYEGRLSSTPGLERQRLVRTRGLDGRGLWLRRVEHTGNQSHSAQEVEAVTEIVVRLLDGGAWVDEEGVERSLSGDDILIVAPYNAQVTRIEERLAGTGVRVGTVDRFQGQEAPVSIYSMTTSSVEDAPRGMEFLYSLNRLNVATSRARCASILVASPALFVPDCRTPHQVRLANALCRFRELAREVPAD